MPPLQLNAITSDSITPPYFISLPPDSERFEVTGNITFNGTDNLPVTGLQVMVVNAKGQRISTVFQTTVSGEFNVELWSTDIDSDATLVIQDQTRRLPKLRLPVDLSDGQQDIEMSPIVLGVNSSLFDLSGSVIGEGPMSDATVSMVSMIGDGMLSPWIPSTQDTGIFHTQLFNGEYIIQVVPPISSPFGMLRIRTSLERLSDLILRPPLKGTFKGISRMWTVDRLQMQVDATLITPDFVTALQRPTCHCPG